MNLLKKIYQYASFHTFEEIMVKIVVLVFFNQPKSGIMLSCLLIY